MLLKKNSITSKKSVHFYARLYFQSTLSPCQIDVLKDIRYSYHMPTYWNYSLPSTLTAESWFESLNTRWYVIQLFSYDVTRTAYLPAFGGVGVFIVLCHIVFSSSTVTVGVYYSYHPVSDSTLHINTYLCFKWKRKIQLKRWKEFISFLIKSLKIGKNWSSNLNIIKDLILSLGPLSMPRPYSDSRPTTLALLL